MPDPSVSKGLLLTSIIGSKCYFCLGACLLLAVFVWSSNAEELRKILTRQASKPSDLMWQIVSPDENVRFGVLEEALSRLKNAEPSEVEEILTSLRKKNISTLLYVLMETRNDALYTVNRPTRIAAENSEGSFPNIVYYYARVRPFKGIQELYRLYKGHKNQRLTICKGIGEIQAHNASAFLMNEVKTLKPKGEDIYAQLSGLKAANYRLDVDEIKWFLNTDLNREEFIAIAQLKANVNRIDLIGIYHSSMIGRSYAIQYVFGNLDQHVNAFKDIISTEIEKGHYQYVYNLMMSDGIRTTKNPTLQEFRKKTVSQVTQFLENPPSL